MKLTILTFYYYLYKHESNWKFNGLNYEMHTITTTITTENKRKQNYPLNCKYENKQKKNGKALKNW